MFNSPDANCTQTAGNFTTCLAPLDRVGLTLVAEAGFISFSALMVLAGLIVRNIIRYRRHPPRYKWSLIQEPADAYVLSLFCADLLQAIGAFMDVRWVHDGSVFVGSYCRAQGAIQQTGETAVALATMCIALHTFVVIWFRKGHHNLKVAYCVIAAQWTFVGLFVIIAATTTGNYYNPDTFWCWIGQQHGLLGDKLGGEYFWLWATLLVSFLVYTPLFLWSKGYIDIDKWRWAKERSAEQEYEEVRPAEGHSRRPDAPSLAILAYPFAYTIVVLPVSIVRWIEFLDKKVEVPHWVTFFTVFLHDSFGAVNVILLLTTRQELLLFKDPREAHRVSEMGLAPETSFSRAPSIRTLDDIRNADAQTSGRGGLEHSDLGEDEVGPVTGHPYFNSYDDHPNAYELSSRRGSRASAGINSAFISAPSLLGSRSGNDEP